MALKDGKNKEISTMWQIKILVNGVAKNLL